MKARYFAILVAIAAALSIFGCGDTSRMRPAQATPIPTNTPPAKVPTTPDEKIAAINRSSLPDDQKKVAIERVRSGKL